MTPAEHAEELLLALKGPCWHGPSLRASLSGVDAALAASHPLPGAHSIWELVLHLTSWTDAVLKRVQGGTGSVSKELNFPAPPPPSQEEWAKAKTNLRSSVDRLLAATIGIPETRLRETVRGKSYNVAFMLSGCASHMLYHAGQISMLKNAARRES